MSHLLLTRFKPEPHSLVIEGQWLLSEPSGWSFGIWWFVAVFGDCTFELSVSWKRICSRWRNDLRQKESCMTRKLNATCWLTCSSPPVRFSNGDARWDDRWNPWIGSDLFLCILLGLFFLSDATTERPISLRDWNFNCVFYSCWMQF